MTVDAPLAETDLDRSTGLILAEEAALKKLVSGVQVPALRGGGTIEVPVWFRWPESTRKIVYPHILIDMIDPSVPDYERWTSVWDVADAPAVFEHPATGERRIGMYSPSMGPDSMPTEATSLLDPERTDGLTKLPYSQTRPLAYKLYYQVSHFSREVRHDRILTARFVTDIFPPRHWFLGVDADATWRRCELVDVASADTMETTEDTKRIFRKVYTVTIEAEIPVDVVHEIEKVRKVHIDTYDLRSFGREAVTHQSNAPHSVAIANTNYP